MSRREKRPPTARARWGWAAFLLLLISSLLFAGCTGTTPTPGQQFSPLATEGPGDSNLSVLPTATAQPSTEYLPSPKAGMSPLQLQVLHTNDNWGETEPCG